MSKKAIDLQVQSGFLVILLLGQPLAYSADGEKTYPPYSLFLLYKLQAFPCPNDINPTPTKITAIATTVTTVIRSPTNITPRQTATIGLI